MQRQEREQEKCLMLLASELRCDFKQVSERFKLQSLGVTRTSVKRMSLHWSPQRSMRYFSSLPEGFKEGTAEDELEIRSWLTHYLEALLLIYFEQRTENNIVKNDTLHPQRSLVSADLLPESCTWKNMYHCVLPEADYGILVFSNLSALILQPFNSIRIVKLRNSLELYNE